MAASLVLPTPSTSLDSDTSTAVVRVLVAARHPGVRFGLARLLGGACDVEVVGAAADAERAVALHGEHLPDVCLVDLHLGGGPGGVEVTRRMVAANPTVRVVLLTTLVDRPALLAAFDAGAAGCLLTDTEPERLVAGVRAAARGEAPLAPQAASALLEDRRQRSRNGGPMSVREQEILSLLGRGLPNKLIARDLGISEKTVKGHLTNIFRGIGVTDRTQAALWVQRTGFVAAA